MKFGVLQFFSWPERRVPLETVYSRALQRVEKMDKTGYDAVWLAEHHFTGYSVCPSVHMMALHIAHRTEHLRIGTAVSLAALYHPLRLAEEVALLDMLTEGRVNWGAGRGFDPVEFTAFDVPIEESAERLHEAVQIVLQAWQSERLDWQGKHWQFDGVEVLPKPTQSPHPPLWIAASSHPAIDWAASQGFSILMDPHSTHSDIAEKRERFRLGLEAAGHTMGQRELPMARLIALGNTEAEAEEIARRGASWTVGSYMNATKASGFPKQDPEQEKPVLTQTEGDPVERYLDHVVIHGTPEKVIDQLSQLNEEMFLDYLMCAPLSHSSFELFTDKVLPAFV
ncbi:MAG: LLM class flavin-dependent oxidoreductase [Myxococcota bacterium]|nr:LLM class flavin-dependent oxidoreductase [Myxococcota bacterium]